MSTDLQSCFLALQSSEPEKNLIRVVLHKKRDGATRDEVMRLLEEFREAVGCNRKDASEAEDRVDDVICDVCDSVYGWCRPVQKIYSEHFDEEAFWADYEACRRNVRLRT